MYFQKWFVYTPEMQVHAEGETASIKKKTRYWKYTVKLEFIEP